MSTDTSNRTARISRLRRIGREQDIPLARHPERDLYPVHAADVARWEAALRADEDRRLRAAAVEDAEFAAILGGR